MPGPTMNMCYKPRKKNNPQSYALEIRWYDKHLLCEAYMNN